MKVKMTKQGRFLLVFSCNASKTLPVLHNIKKIGFFKVP